MLKIAKPFLFCLFFIVTITIAKAQTTTKDTTRGPEIYFKNMVYDYGTIKKGADGNCEFTFTNTGTDTLELHKVKSSCGCTIPSWSDEPVPPGGKGVIKVKYDTKKVGNIYKTISVMSDAKTNPVILTITGTVTE